MFIECCCTQLRASSFSQANVCMTGLFISNAKWEFSAQLRSVMCTNTQFMLANACSHTMHTMHTGKSGEERCWDYSLWTCCCSCCRSKMPAQVGCLYEHLWVGEGADVGAGALAGVQVQVRV